MTVQRTACSTIASYFSGQKIKIKMTKGKLRHGIIKKKTGFLNITVSNVMMEWTAGIKVIMVTLTRLDWAD